MGSLRRGIARRPKLVDDQGSPAPRRLRGAEPQEVTQRCGRSAARSAVKTGQTMAEYGVVLTVITIATLGALQYLGGGVAKAFLTVSRFIA